MLGPALASAGPLLRSCYRSNGIQHARIVLGSLGSLGSDNLFSKTVALKAVWFREKPVTWLKHK